MACWRSAKACSSSRGPTREAVRRLSRATRIRAEASKQARTSRTARSWGVSEGSGCTGAAFQGTADRSPTRLPGTPPTPGYGMSHRPLCAAVSRHRSVRVTAIAAERARRTADQGPAGRRGEPPTARPRRTHRLAPRAAARSTRRPRPHERRRHPHGRPVHAALRSATGDGRHRRRRPRARDPWRPLSGH